MDLGVSIIRPSKVYKRGDRQAFTRRQYIKKDVEKKLMKMVMGDTARQDFPIQVKLVTQESLSISASSLESVRTNINRHLLEKIGKGKPENYRLQVVPYPHHYAREHGLIGVAKGERFVKGMRQSFGKVTRRMANVKKGKPILVVGIEKKEDIQIIKEAFRIARCKLPKINQGYKVVIEK